MEFNKVFASLLIAGIIAMLAGFIAKQIVHPEPLEKNAVMIEAAEESSAGGATKIALPEPIMALLSTADVARGQQVAKACAACHNFEKNGKDGVGPHLWGVVGRTKSSVPGFAYSGELEKVGDPNWTYASLNKFLWKPKSYAPGTKMNFIGIKKPEDRAAVIAYLHSLNDTPMPWPTEADIANEAAELTPPEEKTTSAETGTPPPTTETTESEQPAPAH